MVVLALAAWLAGSVFGTLPGDAISPAAAIGYALWVGLIALVSGSVAWVLAPFIGRAGAAGIAGFVLIAGFLVNGYQSFVPVLGAIANLSWFSLDRRPPAPGGHDGLAVVDPGGARGDRPPGARGRGVLATRPGCLQRHPDAGPAQGDPGRARPGRAVVR